MVRVHQEKVLRKGRRGQVEESLNQAYNQVIEESCKTMSYEQCQILKDYAKTAKTTEDLQDYALKINKGLEIVSK